MNSGASDEQLKELLDDTKALLAAAQSGDSDEIGRQLEKREKSIDAVKAAGGAAGSQTEARKELIREILRTDALAKAEISKLVNKYAKTASDYQKKAAGVLKYSYSKFNFMNGQLIDKKD